MKKLAVCLRGMHMSKMGRPKSDNNKDKIVAVRLTEEEHQRLGSICWRDKGCESTDGEIKA